MKIYTSEVSQFGRKLLVLNEEVTFDNIGCTEVEDKFGKRLVSYSDFYTDYLVPPKKVEEKPKTMVDELKDREIELLNDKIAKLNIQIDSRKNKFVALEQENQDIRKDMQKIVDEDKILKEDKEKIVTSYNLEIEDYQHKFDLALLDIDKLKETCGKMGIEEKEYIKRKSKKPLIELIIKASK